MTSPHHDFLDSRFEPTVNIEPPVTSSRTNANRSGESNVDSMTLQLMIVECRDLDCFVPLHEQNNVLPSAGRQLFRRIESPMNLIVDCQMTHTTHMQTIELK